MRATEFIAELFDINNLKGFPLENANLSYGMYQAHATDDAGQPIKITIATSGPKDRSTAAINFTRAGSYSLTGGRQEFKVFATVLDSIKDFLSKSEAQSEEKPRVFVMSARPEKRRRTYQSIASRVAPTFGYEIGTLDELSPILRTAFDEGSSLVLVDPTRPKIDDSKDKDSLQEATAVHLQKLPKFFKNGDPLAELVPERKTHTFALHPDKWIPTFQSLTGKDPEKLKYYRPEQVEIVPGTLVGDMVFANQFYRAKTNEDKQKFALLYKKSLRPYDQADVNDYRMPEILIPKNIQDISESTEMKLGALCTIKTNFEDADFWVIRRGSESMLGKPTNEFYPEHIGIKVTATDVLDPRYLYYIMQYLHMRGYFKQLAHGSTNLVSIKPSDIKDIRLEDKKMKISEIVNFSITKRNLPQSALNELFEKSSAYPFVEPPTLDGDYYIARAIAKDGKELGFQIHNITLSTKHRNNQYPKIIEVEFTKEGMYDLSGEGDQYRIFTTAMEFINHYLKDVGRPAVIVIGADVTNRYSLYSRIAKSRGAALNYQIVDHSRLPFSLQARLHIDDIGYNTLVLVDNSQSKVIFDETEFEKYVGKSLR